MARRLFLARALMTGVTLFGVLGSLAACDAQTSESARSGTPGKPRPITPVAGCAKGWTDPADASAARAPARCSPGAPAPKPLKKKTKIVVSAGTLTAEYLAPLRIGMEKGEFSKEKLDVELKLLPTPDALPLLAKGDIDVQYAAPEAAVLNGIRQGFDIRWVAGNFTPAPGSRSGFWARLKPGETAGEVSLKDRTVGTLIGKGSVIMYPMEKVLAAHQADVDSVRFQQLGPAEVLTSLKNGGVDAAWLLDPVWRQVDGDTGYAFLGGQPRGEPLGGLLFGPDLLTGNPDAGVAFLRAYIRTVNTYFAGDYKKDQAFLDDLGEALKTEPDTLAAVPSLRMDWEIRSGTVERLQKAYATAGVVEGDPLPEDRVVDRSFYTEAVGHKP
ncbi:ABC transporter substrate-binding protein [Streptomyces sp. 4503]|uniref:ABC transporter substrate-binding protein n=1 Tax=Streptomyces niphimycinicus TaxID=2842201 RepID=A0ABS6CJA6_9ACTN|nr:ABC transporter substrate-binding protein [Streptomyces niphimycinicus]MBU3866998.1 ABC transporter substrate-binding protein [Streptomyces niphimycinicus]